VAELLRVKVDAKQNTRGLNDALPLRPLTTKTNRTKNSLEFFYNKHAQMLITKGSLGVASLRFILLQFVPTLHRPARALVVSEL